MFKIIDGKIKVMSKYVLMSVGTHDIYINSANGSVIQGARPQGDWYRICTYSFNADTGAVDISGPNKHIGGCRRVMRGITAGNRVLLSQTILYAEPNGYGPTMSSYLEGFNFLFNYTAFANVVAATVPYKFASGRVCFDSMTVKNTMFVQAMYFTALPTSLSCGSDGWDAYGNTSPIEQMYGSASAMQNAQTADIFEYLQNRTSIAFFYRTSRKYMFFSRNVGGLFSLRTKEGLITLESGTDEPEADGVISGIGSASFQFSMFNLKQ